MGALKSIRFKACSEVVDAALGPDMMKSVVRLIPDILQAGLPILIYEGEPQKPARQAACCIAIVALLAC